MTKYFKIREKNMLLNTNKKNDINLTYILFQQLILIIPTVFS